MNDEITLEEFRLPMPMFLAIGRDKKGNTKDRFYIRTVTAYRASKTARALSHKSGLYFTSKMVNLIDTEISWDQWCEYLLSDISGLSGGREMKQQTVGDLLTYRDKCHRIEIGRAHV